MALKDIGDTIGDLAQAGLLVSKKLFALSLADDRDLSQGMVSELVDRLHPGRVPARVAEIVDETPSTSTLRLVPVGEPFPPFRAGQFVNLFLTVDGVATARPYSISSPPSRPGYIDITVRKMPGGFVSAYLCDGVKVGDEFELSGPWGSFYHEPLMDTRDLVFLAGGSGVTPFMSMIREEVDLKREIHMHLVYGSRTPDDIIFADELFELACCEDSLKVDIIISEPNEDYSGRCGLLDAPMIIDSIDGIEGKTFLMCGPHAMYGLCLGALEELGVLSRRIKTELSGPAPDITVMEGWPPAVEAGAEVSVTVENGGRKKAFKAACREPLLNSLERNLIEVDNLCRSGECAVCRTKLVSGDVFMPATVALRKADVQFGYIHPCMSYPVSDLIIRL